MKVETFLSSFETKMLYACEMPYPCHSSWFSHANIFFLHLMLTDVLYVWRLFHKPAYSSLTWPCIWTNGHICVTSVVNHSDRNLSYGFMSNDMLGYESISVRFVSINSLQKVMNIYVQRWLNL